MYLKRGWVSSVTPSQFYGEHESEHLDKNVTEVSAHGRRLKFNIVPKDIMDSVHSF